MIVIYCQHRESLTAAERQMVAAMRDLPGVLLVNALVTSGRRTRELDGVWLHPQGLVAIEVKGTSLSGAVEIHQNGPWRIGGEPADFASGPNPLLQARTAAQMLRRTLVESRVEVGFIPAVLAVAGHDLDLVARAVGDMPVAVVGDLPQVRSLTQPSPVGCDDVSAVLAALDLGDDACPDEAELAGEGFAAGSCFAGRRTSAPAKGGSGSDPAHPGSERRSSAGREDKATSRARRRARRLADLQAQAQLEWRNLHRRRLVASILAAVLLALLMLAPLPPYCLSFGLVAGAVAGAVQLSRRRHQAGARAGGVAAVLLWVLSLVPFVGGVSALAWAAAVPYLPVAVKPFILQLSVLAASAMGCAVLSGRSAFVYPPAEVVERYDEQGRPTGAFMLAKVRTQVQPGQDWRPASSDPDPDSTPASATGS